MIESHQKERHDIQCGGHPLKKTSSDSNTMGIRFVPYLLLTYGAERNMVPKPAHYQND